MVRASSVDFPVRPPRPEPVPNLFHVYAVQDVRLDPVDRRVWRGDDEIALSRKEFDLVHALIARAGEIVTREQLMREVWETTFWTSSKTIDVHLGWVRRKLGDDTRRPSLITTIRGQGLRFERRRRGDSRSPPETAPRDDATAALNGRTTTLIVVTHAPAGQPAAPTLAVIGGGQLARMMAQPAIALGLPLRLLAEAEGVVRRAGDPRPPGRRLPRPGDAARR